MCVCVFLFMYRKDSDSDNEGDELSKKLRGQLASTLLHVNNIDER